MLHARRDYNRRIQDIEDAIPEDEPVFLLRAQDKFAPAALDNYASIVAKGETPDQALIINTVKHAEAMRVWQEKNLCKEPDMDIADALYCPDADEALKEKDEVEKKED